jgi:hypothetical protein
MMEQTRQLKRIADALEARNEAAFVRIKLHGDDIKLGDMVIWKDPETGEATSGWKVVRVPELPDGSTGDVVDPLGVYGIVQQDGSAAEAHACELMVDRPSCGGANA